jgi:hypothetical protein
MVAAVAAAAAAGSLVALAGPADAREASVHGCPSGYVCLYKYDNYRGVHGTNKPDAKLFTYGVHQIYGFTAAAGSTVDNQYGYYNPHDSYQYFGAACYYRHSNGTGFYTSDRGFPAQSNPHFDLLPVNSVRLVKITAKNRYNWCPA